MAVKESDLVTVGSSDITGSDFVRVLDGATSRKQTVDSFVETLDPLLVTAGFEKGSITPIIEQRKLIKTTINYSVAITDSVILVDTAAGNINVSMPLVSTFWDAPGSYGQQITIKKITTDLNKVVIIPVGAETIDGNTSVLLLGPELVSVTLISDGNFWHIVS